MGSMDDYKSPIPIFGKATFFLGPGLSFNIVFFLHIPHQMLIDGSMTFVFPLLEEASPER